MLYFNYILTLIVTESQSWSCLKRIKFKPLRAHKITQKNTKIMIKKDLTLCAFCGSLKYLADKLTFGTASKRESRKVFN